MQYQPPTGKKEKYPEMRAMAGNGNNNCPLCPFDTLTMASAMFLGSRTSLKNAWDHIVELFTLYHSLTCWVL